VLRLVYGGAYVEAAPLLRLLALAAFLQCGGVIVSAVVVGLGRLWVSLAIQCAGQVVLIGLALALMPAFALAGLGVAHVAAAGLSLLLGLRHLGRGIGLALEGLRALLPLAALAWVGAALLDAAGGGGLGPALALAGAVALLEAARLRDDERQWLRAAARRLVPGGP
jgi:O-antigen/teichoic acid export membrane protein